MVDLLRRTTKRGKVLVGRPAEVYSGECPPERPCQRADIEAVRQREDGEAADPLPAQTPALPAPTPPRSHPCIHLGGDSGHRPLCPSCRGKVEVKLLGCAVHGLCSVARAVPDAACCVACTEYVSQE